MKNIRYYVLVDRDLLGFTVEKFDKSIFNEKDMLLCWREKGFIPFAVSKKTFNEFVRLISSFYEDFI